jgi:hypothetical protein
LLRLVSQGLTVFSTKRIPLTARPSRTPIPAQEAERRTLEQEIATLLAKEAIVPIRQPAKGFWSRIFLVPKPGDRWRVILNLKPLNQHLETRRFKMDTIQAIAPLLDQDLWATSLDLKDA